MEQTAADDVLELQSHAAMASVGGKSAPEAAYCVPIAETPSGCLRFIKRKGRYRAAMQLRLRNSLFAGIGFFELTNAGDFAANVWNEVPVPVHAVVLMAIGGSVALSIIYFAVRDAVLSWDNVRGLRAERRFLRWQKVQHSRDRLMARTLDCLLDVNFRETGMELVDRFGVDVFMGFGALLVGIGTYMAIGGANEAVFHASNLLSGYVGNAPCALYGLFNMLWSAFVWRRARRHRSAATKRLGAGKIDKMLDVRTFGVELHSSLNGITGVVAGAASLVTATMWWVYVVLVPCIVLSVATNFWRHRIGYERSFVAQVVPFDDDSLVAELVHVNSARERVTAFPSDPLSVLVSEPTSVPCVEFTRNQLFEEFCLRVLADAQLSAALFDTSGDAVTIEAESLAAVDVALGARLVEISRKLVAEAAPGCFSHRERYLLEALGCYICNPKSNQDEKT